MRSSSSSTEETHVCPQLYRQLQLQLRQWIKPKDRRHLEVFLPNNDNPGMVHFLDL